jgi:UDP-N-acetyl-D-glucosamine dehydrogenase
MSDIHLTNLIERRTACVGVIGQGYVGLPLAVEFARAGFSVTGFDTDPDRLSALKDGRSHSPDVTGEDLQPLLQSGRYRASGDFSLLSHCDVVIICVPTPLRKSKDPDISFVVAAAEQVAAQYRPGQLIILESTTYPGTTDELLLPMFKARGAVAGVNFFLAFSPERIDPANPTFKVRDVPKVVGGVTPVCGRLAALLYGQIAAKVVEVSSPKVAELAKLYENVFRNVNIALANELAVICHHLGMSVWEVIDAAATKPFGFMPFYPGPGIGGHCIPVDPFYLSWTARLNGYETKFIGLADEINQRMPAYVLTLLADALSDRGKPVKDARILVLGAAYKRGVGDIRESPALVIMERLLQKRALVRYVDPLVPRLTVLGEVLEAAPLTVESLRWSDAVLIVTDHREFDYELVVREGPLVVDTRNATRGLVAPADRIVRL